MDYLSTTWRISRPQPHTAVVRKSGVGAGAHAFAERIVDAAFARERIQPIRIARMGAPELSTLNCSNRKQFVVSSANKNTTYGGVT